MCGATSGAAAGGTVGLKWENVDRLRDRYSCGRYRLATQYVEWHQIILISITRSRCRRLEKAEEKGSLWS